LAESSSKNAKEASNTLKELIVAIEKTGMNVARSGDSFHTIHENVDIVHKVMAEINSSIKELSLGSDEIIKATVTMNELTSDVSDAVKTTSGHQVQAGKNLAKLGDFVLSLYKNMEEIREGSAHIRMASQEVSEKCNHINVFVKDFSVKLEES